MASPPYKFRADGSITGGRVAIYESSDDAPWSDPLSYKTRVLFHSDLAYIARVATVTGSITFPARSNPNAPPGFEIYGHQLAAHGLSGIPLVEGRYIGAGDGGADLPAVGSVPVQRFSSSGSGHGNWRWLTLGADDTYLRMHEGVAPVFSGSGFTLPSITIDYEIHILDRLFTP